MSGIIGIVNLDGRPVSRELLRRMTDFMAYRGPDAQQIWSAGHIGFGHAMLRTTRESINERQPLSLDREVWITADARIDGRNELIGKLESKVAADLAGVTDVELILHAYNAWGEGCLEHLIGDFAFAIWDGRKRRLFCARDHFGVKPFYYAHVDNSLIFSNTLNCVRLHPAVSDELNERAIGDFLLFGLNQEFNTTTFADIKRLPPAHYLLLLAGRKQARRYWTLPTEEQIRYRRDDEYVEHFKYLLREAVGDRLRAKKIAVSMSGGLDSTSVAAIAKEVSSEKLDLQAFTMIYDRLIPDQERYYSGLAAEGLGIPIHYLVLDDYKLYERWGCPEHRFPEPMHFPLSAFVSDHLMRISSHSRIVLSGDGGDPALYFSQAYFAQQLKRFRFWPVASFIARYVRTYRRFPKLGFRTTLKRWAGTYLEWKHPYPIWVEQVFADRYNLQARLEWVSKVSGPIHPTRPEAYNFLTMIDWPNTFECADPGATSIPVEYRYPFFDLRLVSYLLAIPPLPWCAHKEIVRRAIKGWLPDPVRLRAKTALAGDPYTELIKQPDSDCIDRFSPMAELTRYIDVNAIPQIAQEKDPYKLWLNTRPVSLNYWLRDYRSVGIAANKESCYEIAR
ncbi:MAG TPA: asparagine synthase-related protein [Blastocatellia bacterium]|nr:asparagine synthase-related protein [Blastocatellia bacterium]